MANIRKQKKEKKRKEAEMNFFASKASFVAGIVLLITILTDILEIFIQIPMWMVICYLVICLAVSFLVLGTKMFDKKLKSKKVSKFGNFLTISSVVFFFIENSVIKFTEVYTDIEKLIAVGFIGCLVIILALNLLFAKY